MYNSNKYGRWAKIFLKKKMVVSVRNTEFCTFIYYIKTFFSSFPPSLRNKKKNLFYCFSIYNQYKIIISYNNSLSRTIRIYDFISLSFIIIDVVYILPSC